MSQLNKFKERLGKAWMVGVKRPLQLRHIYKTIEHLHGPGRLPYGPDELIVLCLVKNGALYINSFVRHYTQLGARHIYFIDNGSSDETVALAQQYSNVTILRSQLPFAAYKLALRHYLIRQFAQPQRWALYVDVDEFFDYPYSNRVPLPALLRYLRQQEYTAVLAHMLDMFPDQPLNAIRSHPDDYIPDHHRYYDITGIVRAGYYFPNNRLSWPQMPLYHGGMRRDRFTPDGPGVLLSKHPLFFLDGRLKPLFISEHSLRHGVVADFTAVLYHYKFLANFAAHAQRAVQEKSYYQNSAEYRAYLQAIRQNPAQNLRQATSCQLHNIQELLDNGFLQASPTFTTWATQHNLIA